MYGICPSPSIALVVLRPTAEDTGWDQKYFKLKSLLQVWSVIK